MSWAMGSPCLALGAAWGSGHTVGPLLTELFKHAVRWLPAHSSLERCRAIPQSVLGVLWGRWPRLCISPTMSPAPSPVVSPKTWPM